MEQSATPQALIVELCRQFYTQGWVSGTGGGISIRQGGRVYLAPSGVQKERIAEQDLYVLDEAGEVLTSPSDGGLKPSACQPLFYNAFRLRNAGAVIHSHALPAMLVTMLFREHFECTQLEMIKGIEGHGYYDRLQVPIIENTAHECDLADSMAQAIEANPRSHAVLVRRHGVYIWGRDWVQAKTHAECYHYLFDAAVQMAKLGLGTGLVADHGQEAQPKLTASAAQRSVQV
ncbi:MAG: methylthioribulose 1-phosphate dehydratase [Polyangiales bacterium]